MLGIRLRKAKLLLQIIILVSFYKRHIRYEEGTQGITLRKWNAEIFDKKVCNHK